MSNTFPAVKLRKNLRKNILQGHPWLYLDALNLPKDLKSITVCKVLDNKNNFVCWGMFCPNSPIAVRVLSLKKKSPTLTDYSENLNKALAIRQKILSPETDCFRLINGEGDLLPGLICDFYADLAVLQFDGIDPYNFWDHDYIADWLLANTKVKSVYYKPRHDSNTKPQTWGDPLKDSLIKVRENNIQFFVDYESGQKTGFLDQRDNRNYVKQIASDARLLNLFSYSGGFSVYAGVGGAQSVTSVDIADGALKLAEKNWLENNLSKEKHRVECADVFEYSTQLQQKFDVVICDPPSLAKSEKQKPLAIEKYKELFSSAANLVKTNGHLVLSSCSSHVSFEDFYEIVIAALSSTRKRGQILRFSGQGFDHPYPHVCSQLRYLKFMDLVIYD